MENSGQIRPGAMYAETELLEVNSWRSTWGAHPCCMLFLYKGQIGSVLDYASICYSGMARTHMLRLERAQLRGIRLALGLMCSTPNNTLEVLSGIPPFPERFVYLNSRYLVAVFYRLDHPLREKLKDLGTMNMSHCIQGYSNVLSMDITPSESFTRREHIDVHGLGTFHRQNFHRRPISPNPISPTENFTDGKFHRQKISPTANITDNENFTE
jgi:hypothetical protein